MLERKENLIMRILKRFIKRKEVKKTKKLTPEQEEENLKNAYRAYYEDKKKMEHKDRLNSVNNELWLSDLGG